MTTELSTQELAAELARREAVAAAKAAADAARLREAQDAYDRHVLATYKSLEQQQADEGQVHLEAARAGLDALDLNAAYAGFCKWKASRIIRSDIRTAAQTAQRRQANEVTLADMREVNQTFMEWLQLETSGFNRPEDAAAAGIADELLGIFPASLADVDN